jgi:hypothetical protein
MWKIHGWRRGGWKVEQSMGKSVGCCELGEVREPFECEGRRPIGE